MRDILPPFLLSAVATLALIALIVLSIGARAATEDPCVVALKNIRVIQDATRVSIDKASAMRSRQSSAKRLAVLSAKEAKGFYVAMRVILPLACHGEEYTSLDAELEREIAAMQAYADKNW